MERDGATARDTRRRRDERGETIVHQPAHRGIDALQHMPERERILRAREREHGANRARSRATLLEVERDQRAHERRRRVLHVRNPRAGGGANLDERAEGDARRAQPGLKLHLAGGDVQHALPDGIGGQRVGAAEIDRRPRGCLDKEETRHGVDFRGDRPVRQRQPMLVRTRNDELHARVRLHFDLSNPAHRHERARRVVGLQPIAHPQPPGGGQPLRADEGTAGQGGDIPGGGLDRAPDHHDHEHRRRGEWDPVPASPLADIDPRGDIGPQIARWLDALRQAAHGLVQLLFVHRSSFSRSRRRARNSCAFDVPSAIPTSWAMSPCPYPSMSYSTNTSRAPSGRSAMARSRSMLSPSSDVPGFFSRTAGSSARVTRRSRRPVVRRSFKTTLTASRCSQELNALSPRNEPNLSHSRTKTSWVRSSASRASPVRRRHNAYTRPACCRYRSRKAVWSPACARATRSSGGGTELRRRRVLRRLERNHGRRIRVSSRSRCSSWFCTSSRRARCWATCACACFWTSVTRARTGPTLSFTTASTRSRICFSAPATCSPNTPRSCAPIA